MTRVRKLAPVVDHVEKLEQDALKAVAFSQQRLQQQQQRLEQLLRYREDYANRHNDGPVTYGAMQLREFQRFMAQLDDTIEQQREVVRLAEREVEFKRQKWKLTRTRSDAMNNANLLSLLLNLGPAGDGAGPALDIDSALQMSKPLDPEALPPELLAQLTEDSGELDFTALMQQGMVPPQALVESEPSPETGKISFVFKGMDETPETDGVEKSPLYSREWMRRPRQTGMPLTRRQSSRGWPVSRPKRMPPRGSIPRIRSCNRPSCRAAR